MRISFNVRLSYKEANDCIEKIKEFGGFGNIRPGGSEYEGTKEQIDKLLIHMSEKNYDLGSMAINETPQAVTQRRVDKLKEKGVI